MKNLEDKIIKKVYEYETKHTLIDIILRAGAIVATFLLSIFLILLIYERLYEQSTLDVLQLFQEDFEVIRQYFGDVVEVLYYETPKEDLLLFIAAAITFIILVLYFVKNFGKIHRKITSLLNYWKK